MRKYYRNFMMFNQEDQGFSANGQPAGYIKTEVREGKGKLFILVQNLKDSGSDTRYRAYLMKCSDDNGFPVDLGCIDVNKNKGELQLGFDPDNVLDSHLAIEDFNIAVIMAEGNENARKTAYPLAASRDKKIGWRKFFRDEATDSHKPDYSFDVTNHEKYETEEILKKQDVFSRFTGGIESIYTKRETGGIDRPDNEDATVIVTSGEGVSGFPNSPGGSSIVEGSAGGTGGSSTVNEISPADASGRLITKQQSDKEQNGTAATEAPLSGEEPAVGKTGQINSDKTADRSKTGDRPETVKEASKPAGGAATVTDKSTAAGGVKAEEKSRPAAGMETEGKNKQQDNGRSHYNCPYLFNNICNIQSFENAGNPKACRTCMAAGQEKGDTRETQPANLEKLCEEFNKYFEPANPFGNRKGCYNWWKVSSPVYLNNILYQQNVKTPLLFNPSVMMAHFKYRHLIIGIYSDRMRQKEYIVGGVPGVYNIDERPFGEMCRWVQLEGYKPRYGAFGYWLAYIDPKTGKLLRVN